MQNTTASETNNFSADSSDEIFEAVGRSFDRAFALHGSNRKSVNSTFEATLEGLKNAKEPEYRLRSIAKSAALSTGRCHGNVLETSRCLLDRIEELAKKHGLKPEIAREQIILGLAEGSCQLGPVVYCRFLDVANTYKDEADEWISRNRRLPMLFNGSALPVIVPYETELTLQVGNNASEPEGYVLDLPAEPTNTTWSRPKGRNFFRKLTDAVGHFFGG